MTNEIPKELMNVVFDGRPDSYVGVFIALLPFILAVFVSVLIGCAIARRRRAPATPLPAILTITVTVFVAAETTAFLWWTGYNLFHLGLSYSDGHGHPWPDFLASLGDKLTWFAWIVPVATIGYVAAWLLRERGK